MNAPTVPFCQRWRDQCATWRPAAGGEIFQPSQHEVVVLEELDAKAFVCSHHYSGSYPAARFRVGLLRAGTRALRDLAGVAVFSMPIQNRAIPKYTGLDPLAGVELGRFVLLDEVEANGESWFLGRAFALLHDRRPDIRAVLSYADPLPRQTIDGRQVTPGHVGTIYQAHNGRYMGRARPETLVIDTRGRVLSRRALSKLKHETKGAGYAYAALLAAGAPPRRPMESGADYVARALRDGPFRRIRHPGNHAYAWPLGDRRERRELLELFAPACAYPKKDALTA